MQDEQRNQEQELDLGRLITNTLRLLRRTFWIVLLAAAVGAALTVLVTNRLYSPVYESRAVLSVFVDKNTLTDIHGTNATVNSQTTRQIINTFPTIISTDAMRERILHELGTEKINGKIQANVIADSNLYTVTVTSSSPDDAHDILEAVLKHYPDLAYLVIGAARVKRIEEPTVPTAPINPRDPVRKGIYGGVLGALLALAVIAFIAQMRENIRTSDDMKRITNLPCVVHIPHAYPKRRSNRAATLSLQSENLPPAYEEAVRVLRTRLLRQLKGTGKKKVLITSTIPGEGKSTIAANLALSLSHSGLHVILVDADLRTQELYAFFGLKGERRGLTELLRSGETDVLSCLTDVPGTRVRLLCGSKLERPVSLLRRDHIAPLLNTLANAADIVLIDTPPIGLLSDAAPFAQCADTALYIVRPDGANASRISDGLEAMADCKVTMLGYILNGVDSRTNGTYGYGYGYHYGYGYGYGYGYKKHKYGYGGYSGYSGYGKQKKSKTRTEPASNSILPGRERPKPPTDAAEAPKVPSEPDPAPSAATEPPAEAPAPVKGPDPVKEPTPVEAPAPVEEATPVEAPTPVEEAAPDEAPQAAEAPAEAEPASDLEAAAPLAPDADETRTSRRHESTQALNRAAERKRANRRSDAKKPAKSSRSVESLKAAREARQATEKRRFTQTEE